MLRKAVFLDRDGTINYDVGYCNHPSRLHLIPGAVESLALLNSAGFILVVITNQAGVAKGFIPEEMLPQIRNHFLTMLKQAGVIIHGYYACPHHPRGSVRKYTSACICRKPSPGLILRAADELSLDLGRSYVIGDKATDIQLGHNVGAQTLLVLTGHGRAEHTNYPECFGMPHHTAPDLSEAVQWILKRADSM